MTEHPGEQKLPDSEKVKVLRFQIFFKGGRWWAVAGLFEAFMRRHIALYLWFKRGDSWERRQKFVFRYKEEWEEAKKAVESFTAEL